MGSKISTSLRNTHGVADLKPRTGKAPLGLLPYAGLEVGSSGMEHGAGKYWPNNWQDCPPDEAFTYVHAALRHMNKIAAGEEIDPESGIPHAGHAIAGLMIFAHLRGYEYAEPNIMKEHPDRKMRINKYSTMFGPRPEHPADVKANPDAYAMHDPSDQIAVAAYPDAMYEEDRE